MTTTAAPSLPVISSPPARGLSSSSLARPHFLVACLVFILINFVAGLWVQIYNEKHRKKENTEVVLSNFMKITEPPDVVIVGSSLVRMPLWLSDLKHSTNGITFDDYSWCKHLAEEVRAKAHKNVRVFDLGINTTMVSDVFLISEKLFIGNHKPRLIVYGLGQRDFMDALVLNDVGTVSFNKLHSFSDFWRQDGLFQTNIPEKVDLFWQALSPIYQHRREWQDRLVRTLLRDLPKAQPPPRPFQQTLEQKRLLAFNRTKATDPVWAHSVAEYEARYAKADRSQFLRQAKYLEAFLALARERGIKVILLKMPMTCLNESLMPPELDYQYDCLLVQAAKQNKFPLVDVEDGLHLSNAYFFDCVHLNAEGGDIISEVIAPEIIKALKLEEPRPRALRNGSAIKAN